MFFKLFKKIYSKIYDVILGGEREKLPIADQKAFVKKFPEPRDDYERSYFKYQCVCEMGFYKRKWLLVFYNIAAFFAYPFIFHRLKKLGATKQKAQTSIDAVVENVVRLRNYDVIPQELKDSLESVHELEQIQFEKAYLTDSAIEICKELRKRYYRHFYFRMIVMMKLAQFNQYLYDYNPKKIVFYSVEREYAGPLQTLLCEKEGSEYVVFMHGDYIYQLSFAFQRYSHYYVWDDAYIKFFHGLKCNCPMSVYQPEKLKGIAKKLDEHECKYFASYYFSAETRAQVEKVHSVFRTFEDMGLRCKFRPHPRYSNIEMLKDVFGEIEMEDTSAYRLEDSITDSLYTVGLSTTVLSQAYFSGKKVAIDDISDHPAYLDLSERQYIMLSRPHILLSDLLAEVKNGHPYDATYGFYTKK